MTRDRNGVIGQPLDSLTAMEEAEYMRDQGVAGMRDLGERHPDTDRLSAALDGLDRLPPRKREPVVSRLGNFTVGALSALAEHPRTEPADFVKAATEQIEELVEEAEDERVTDGRFLRGEL